eukprot:CAMPEP_0171673946 /NCGR_PEP_ID=MMETSP0990-20121206/52919_1 /TAXON_ID=483369 /ORGANISM="non described non described, Strain CCMP2098" /LENGTH=159 /DNA_ID=CAMNT_0012259587 /DNA_START=202 /DNA_END=682 /DNA_ORIENTATION=-
MEQAFQGPDSGLASDPTREDVTADPTVADFETDKEDDGGGGGAILLLRASFPVTGSKSTNEVMPWPLGKASWGCFRSNASKVFIAATDDSTSKFTGRALLAEEAEGQGLNGGSYSMAIILSQSIQDVKKGLAEICLESPCAPSLLEGGEALESGSLESA